MSDLKERLLQAFLDEGLIESKTPLPEGQGYHCSACSCYGCKNAVEDCVCDTNGILKVVEEVFANE